jgi:hypothetical protein
MIELRQDALHFSFPKVHKSARLTIDLQRTLRIPDDGEDYPLPPGLGRFPLRHVEDYEDRVPRSWIPRGGVFFPMYQSEAMWICFASEYDSERGVSYPFAVKIATGKVCAVSGKTWCDGIQSDPQNYVVAPRQPWLDGYCVEKGVIRQFVAMPLGSGYSAEEQVTGAAEYGGIQIQAYPMKREVYESRFPKIVRRREVKYYKQRSDECSYCIATVAEPEMGLAPGGRMKQEIYDDPYSISDWDTHMTSRCFVHIANSMVWQSITGHEPPTPPPTAAAYTRAGLPWFDWYDDKSQALKGSDVLGGMKSVVERGNEKGDVPVPENASTRPGNVVALKPQLKPGQVREWEDGSCRTNSW